MTAEVVTARISAQPFKTFRLRLPDGRAVEVPHPDFVSLSPDHRHLLVWIGNKGMHSVVDLELVSDIEFDFKKKARRKTRLS